ncbi:histidine-specific methyltransferase, partial [Polychytrium aggregatum]|uniref:histidine-specific methyltransferase n=1 Tax=Polychytrium aggregatum TaxID=110093 RepID=UPI0022FF1C5D
LRSIPTLVLYDDRGLDIFDKITYLDEYYLTNAEIDILTRRADEIVASGFRGHSEAIWIELGVGSMRKSTFIFDAIVKSNRQATYYALDLSEQTLKDCLTLLASQYPSINFVGLLGTYEDSLGWIRDHLPADVPRSFLWLGSSIGNMTRREAGAFLGKVCRTAMNPGDLFFCGIDRRNAAQVIAKAYDDSHGVTRDFIMNGLSHVNAIFGFACMDPGCFEYLSIYNENEGRHEAYYRSRQSQTIDLRENGKVQLDEGELIHIEYSYKYAPAEVAGLARVSGFSLQASMTDSRSQYDL